MSSEPKTKPTGASVEAFIEAVEPTGRREDARVVCQMLGEVSGCEPEMWGPSIVGFGRYRYTGPNGKPAEWPRIGFSPRKANLVMYLAPGFEQQQALMSRLGKHKVGVSCLYLGRLKDIDMTALRELAERSLATTRERYPA